MTPLLSEGLIAADKNLSLPLAKPGHWTSTVQRMKADRDNFDGRTTVAPVDARGSALVLPHTPFQMTSSRPALLAKGQAKRVENELLVPTNAARLQVAADSGACLGFALRDRKHAVNASPAALRLECVRDACGASAWQVRKCRGGPAPARAFVPGAA